MSEILESASEGFVSPADENEEEELTGFDRMNEDDSRPDYVTEGAGEAFYDNQPTYWDTVDPGEFWAQFEDAYSGEFDSDADFAQDMAENIGVEIDDVWPNRCIDWNYAARELMYDYFESGGYYFRNL